MAGTVLVLMGVAAAVPQPQLRSEPSNDGAKALTDAVTGTSQVDPAITTDVIKEVLPPLWQALTDTSGRPMERFNRIALAFLPAGRAAIQVQSKARANYDTEKYTKQQEAAEATVPVLLDAIKSFVVLFPQPNIPTNFNTQVDLTNVPTFDSPLVPNTVIKGQKIPATEFVPEIVIPDIAVQ